MVGPTIGSIDIIADESIRYIVEQEENIFERTYKHAKVNITYLPEHDMFRKFMEDSTRVIITTRPLSAEEISFFEQRQSHPQQTAFATGALAFIVSSNSRDTVYDFEEIMGMFQQQNGKTFVIENAKSGISTEMMKLIGTDSLPPHFYALKSKNDVVDYVSGHENAIGILDWSEISDSDNNEAQKLLASIQLIGIKRPVDSIQAGYLRPYQYNLQDRLYPFTRDLYFINRTGRSDVATGFASFIAGEIGQKIILKSGLLPKFQSERILEIRNSPDIKVVN